MSFPYQPLEGNEIRLLKLVSQESNPVFKLVHASSNSKPSYAALSYQWGRENNVSQITVNEHKFMIRQNLDDALRQIIKSELIDRYIWIDAICIDQASDDEKSVQVMRMRQIYEGATKVLVWLGKPPNLEHNKLAFIMLDDLQTRFVRYQRAQHFKQWRPWWWARRGRSQGDVEAAFTHWCASDKDNPIFDVPGSSTHQAWLGLMSLLQSEWWTRTWVFQEATIPEKFRTYYIIFNKTPEIPSKVKFLFGDQQTDWHRLSLAERLADHITQMPGIDSGLLQVWPAAFKTMKNVRFWRCIEDLPSFLQIMHVFRVTDCSDPRDKVYAPLCLAPDHIRHVITPDYKNKTASELYTDIARYYISQGAPNLDFLGYVTHQEQSSVLRSSDSEGVESTLPSWVPNFSYKLNIWPIPKTLHVPVDLESRRIRIIDTRGFPSNKDAKQQSYHPLAVTLPAPYVDGLELCISGVSIDEVKDIIQNLIPGKDKEAIRDIAREKGRKWHTDANNKYFTGESFNDAYWRALVFDLVYDYLNRAAGRGGKYDNELQRKSIADLTGVEIKYQKEMKEAFLKANISRSIAVGQKQYILIVPNTTEVGDMIWAFIGGRVLYVIRPIDRKNNHYTFIGECYVHGLMDGELDRKLHIGEAKIEQIRLI